MSKRTDERIQAKAFMESKSIVVPQRPYTQDQVNAIRVKDGEYALASYDALVTFGALDKLIQKIDLLATHANRKDLEKLLEGYDGKLSELYTLTIGKWRLINVNFAEKHPRYKLGITRRINAIQLVPTDQGDTLRQVIKDISNDEMSQMADRAINKIRQGGGAWSKTRRLFVLIEEQRRFTRGWDDTMTNIIKRLNQHSDNPEDSDDPEILGDLLKKRAEGGMADLKKHGHTTYHNYERSNDYKRWITTDEYKDWKKSL